MTIHTPITPAADIRRDTQATDLSTLPDTALVPVEPRHDGWTPQRQRAFIEMLADSGNVTAAAHAVGMTPQSAWRLRRRADAAAFDAAWEAALERALQQLLPAAIDRALNGTLRERWYAGEVVATERVYHDKLLQWLIERGAGMLGAARERRALRRDWAGHMDALEAGAPPPAPSAEPAPRLPEQVPDYEWDTHEDHWITTAPPAPQDDPEELEIEDADLDPSLAGWRYATTAEAETFERWVGDYRTEAEAARRRFFAAPRPPMPPGFLREIR